MGHTNKFNLPKIFQNFSLFGLLILIISLPMQIHIFGQSNTINISNVGVQSELKVESVELQSLDNETELKTIQVALEGQKNKVNELRIPKIVIKPPVPISLPTPPKIQKFSDPSLQELKELIGDNCTKYSCNTDQLIRVMMCESGGTNHRDTFYKGPFQFLASTFYANAKRVGIGDADVLDARQQVQVAAYMFGIGQANQWGCK